MEELIFSILVVVISIIIAPILIGVGIATLTGVTHITYYEVIFIIAIIIWVMIITFYKIK